MALTDTEQPNLSKDISKFMKGLNFSSVKPPEVEVGDGDGEISGSDEEEEEEEEEESTNSSTSGEDNEDDDEATVIPATPSNSGLVSMESSSAISYFDSIAN